MNVDRLRYRIIIKAFLVAGALWTASRAGLNLLLAQPGAVDPGFNRWTGITFVGSSPHASIAVVVPTPDGKLLIGGTFFTVDGVRSAYQSRLNLDGSVDPSFDLAGSIYAPVYSIALQSDGKILFGEGSAFSEGVIRLNPGGTLDSSLRLGGALNGNGKLSPLVRSLVIQPDGKMLIGGSFFDVHGVPHHIARLNSTTLAGSTQDTTIDKAFAPEADQSFAGVQQVLLQNDGRILVLGSNKLGGTQIDRLNPDGSTDGTFHPPIQADDDVGQMAIQSDGKIILAGNFHNATLALRINSDGSVDPSFLSVRGDSSLAAGSTLALQGDGKIMMGGSFLSLNGLTYPPVVRLNPDGTLDGNFQAAAGVDALVSGLVMDNAGDVVVSGQQITNGVPVPYLMRLQGGEPAPTAPVFRIQPVEQVFNDGKSVALAASVSAFPLPTYQWEFNGHDIPGATHSLLTLTNFDVNDAGSYQLQASNSLGSTASQPVSIIGNPPTILLQPISQSVEVDQDVSFSVVATNSLPLTYQWQWNGTNIVGATQPTLTLLSVQISDGGNYSVLVSTPFLSMRSATALLVVQPASPPTILLQPLSQSAEVGQNVGFSVVATNYLPLTYQWQFNGTNIGGATQPTLTLHRVQISDGGNYTVLVSSPLLSRMSATALLVVQPVSFVPGPGVVTNADQASLQAALNSQLPVTFAINDTITLTNTLVITTNTTLDATGRSVFLDGNSAVRHFVVTNGATLRLINLTLVNGRFVGTDGTTNQNASPGYGGSICNCGANLELIGCRFINNSVLGGSGGPPKNVGGGIFFETVGSPGLGGAIYSSYGQLRATNCSFANNNSAGGHGQGGSNGSARGADAFGGALFSSNGVVRLVSVSFSNNLAQAGETDGGRPWEGGGQSHGGAFADVSGTALVTNCVFVGNQALGASNVVPGGSDQGSANAGALFHDGGTMIISQTLFSSNSVTGGGGISRSYLGNTGANGNGGAVFNQAGDLELTSCAVLFNRANGGMVSAQAGQGGGVSGKGSGGAIFNSGLLTLVNCTVADNGAVGGLPGYGSGGSAYGGFLFNTGGSASLVNVTAADNYTTPGTSAVAVAASIFNASGSVALTNSILFCSSSQTNASGTISDGGHNLCSDASASFTLPTSHNSTDPSLGPLSDNGGPTPTMALLPDSPAIDAGDDSACPPTDQRGVPRPKGLACDIGAFELTPTLTLATAQQGKVSVEYRFQAGQTNHVSASTNLLTWESLGTKVAGTNGACELEQVDFETLPIRLYRVEPAPMK